MALGRGLKDVVPEQLFDQSNVLFQLSCFQGNGPCQLSEFNRIRVEFHGPQIGLIRARFIVEALFPDFTDHRVLVCPVAGILLQLRVHCV